MKTKFLLLFISCTALVCAQDLIIDFTDGHESIVCDSIIACNLRTGESVTISPSDSLFLKAGTGIYSIESYGLSTTIYPNPIEDQSCVSIQTQEAAPLKLCVLNQAGQVVVKTETTVEPGQHKFSVSLKSAGIYTLQVNSGDKMNTLQFVSAGIGENDDDISYLGMEGKFFKSNMNGSSSNMNTLGYILGDCIRYTFKGGPHTTIIQEEPRNSKNHIINFYPCTDQDGGNYAVAIIGDQIWMAENLAYLPSVSPQMIESTTEKHYYVYGYDGNYAENAKNSDNYKKYGVLYNWEAAMNSCPTGWHLPSDIEWCELEDYCGMSSLDQNKGGWRNSGKVGKKLKSCDGWFEEGCGTNAFGLNLYPSGWSGDNSFNDLEVSYVTWTSTDLNTTVFFRETRYDEDGIHKNTAGRKYAAAVRCIKDQ